MKKKKIIFLDGDGTLWYPKATKRTKKSHWVYEDSRTKDTYLDHIELTPQTGEALALLRERGIYLVVISAHPSPNSGGLQELENKLAHFNLLNVVHAYYVSDGSDPGGKAPIIARVVQEFGFTSNDAVMVGDNYFYDYLAAKSVGVDAFFIRSDVARMPEVVPDDLQSINEVHELLHRL